MDGWVEQEIAGCDFPDQRLKARLGKLLSQLGGKIGGALPAACQDWAATKAAYRFFGNHDIPSSGAGTVGTNYGQTDFGYDAVGRRNRAVSPGGTITRTVFDVRGQAIETWIGTDDTGATDSEASASTTAANSRVDESLILAGHFAATKSRRQDWSDPSSEELSNVVA
ncbi:MAG: transposase [Planctomycetota bacterium]|nr:transposase [Planctomycetaceae bacterium]MDQ3331586.1 transposase [Planctomycetota bacterium]